MSVYSHGDKDRDRDRKEEPKKGDDLLKEAGKAVENVGKSLTSLFTSKDKKWEKKGGGHKLGSSSEAPPPPPPRQPPPEAPARAQLPPPPRAMTPAAAAAAAREAAIAKQRAGGARPTSAAARAAADRTASQTSSAQANGAHTRPSVNTSSAAAASGNGASRPVGGLVAPAYRVDDSSVALCVEMGFNAPSAREALASNNGDVQAAIELLASGFQASQPTQLAPTQSLSTAAPPSPPPPPLANFFFIVRVTVPEEIDARLAAAHDAAAALAAEGASALPALALLKKLLRNVLSAPEDPKFRRVRLSNNIIAGALGGRAAAHALLQLCGFELPAVGRRGPEAGEPGVAGQASAAGMQEVAGEGQTAAEQAAMGEGQAATEGLAPAEGPKEEHAMAGGRVAGEGQADTAAEMVMMGDAAASATAALEECLALVSQAEEWAQSFEAGPSEILVLYAPDGCTAARVQDMGEDFYRLTPDDAKAMVATAAARREREGVLQTRAHREADAARRRRKYRKASIRVRFGDGTMLQATFAVSAPVSRILGLVSESLRQPGTEFELCPPRGRPLSEPSATIEAADLAPAALLTFRPAQPMEPPFLTQELLDQMTPLNAVAVSLPAGEGGISAAEPTHIHATVAQPRAPKGAPK